jgi:hypothetical protein
MDFGDILKAWERESSSNDARNEESSRYSGPPPSGKKANPDRVSRALGRAVKGDSFLRSAVLAEVPDAEGVRRAQVAWLDRYGVPEEARRDGDPIIQGPPPKRELARLPIDGTIDLHGMTVPDAIASLELFFCRAETSGWRKVLIVHGKGIHSKDGPILVDTVRRWLERRPSAGRSGPADAELGGGGATWVLLKGDQRSR